MPDEMPDICDQISARRTCGYVTCAIQDCETAPADVFRQLDAFAGRFGFTGLGSNWAEVSLEDAKTIIREILFKDLAYHMAIMPLETASALTEGFLSWFHLSVRWPARLVVALELLHF